MLLLCPHCQDEEGQFWVAASGSVVVDNRGEYVEFDIGDWSPYGDLHCASCDRVTSRSELETEGERHDNSEEDREEEITVTEEGSITVERREWETIYPPKKDESREGEEALDIPNK